MLRRIFGPKREEDGSWRKLHNEFHSLYSSLNIVRVMKSRRMKCERCLQGSDWEARREKGHWEDLGVGGRITLRWTLGKKGLMRRTGVGWLRIGSGGGLLWTW
jgi:hypothetical protein